MRVGYKLVGIEGVEGALRHDVVALCHDYSLRIFVLEQCLVDFELEGMVVFQLLHIEIRIGVAPLEIEDDGSTAVIAEHHIHAASCDSVGIECDICR